MKTIIQVVTDEFHTVKSQYQQMTGQEPKVEVSTTAAAAASQKSPAASSAAAAPAPPARAAAPAASVVKVPT